MSQHFFYRISLTILFISMNLFSMQNQRLINNDTNLDGAEKNEQYKDQLVYSPSSLPHFKQQSITLENNPAHLYSLIFNRKQDHTITHYVLNGKSIGQLTQIGDEINFESNKNKSARFAVQIPYQARSVSLAAQGRFIFKKTINTDSAFIIGKRVHFYDPFLSNNRLIVQAGRCKTRAQLSCFDFLFNGKKFEIMPKGSLNAHNYLTLTANSLLLNKGIIRCTKESFIESCLFKNSGRFTSGNMHFEGNTIINSGELTIKDSFHCASRLFEHTGALDVSGDFILEKGDSFSSTDVSVLNVNRDWKSFITYLSLQGSVSIKNLYFTGKNFTAKSLLHCIAENACLKIQEDMINEGVIKVSGLLDVDSKNIKLTPTSDIMVTNADFKVDHAIENDGFFSAKNNLSVHARTISNKGEIETDSLNFKADHYFYNAIRSQLSAKNNLTINTPLSINLLGLTHAQYMTINSALGLNALGIYAAKNLSLNSLVSVNAGLLLPKFSSFSDMYSLQNLRGLAESLFIKNVHIYGIMYSTLKNLYGLCQQGISISSEIRSLYKQKNLRTADIIALICLMKNSVDSAQQTYSLANQSYSLLPQITAPNNPSPKIEVSDAIIATAENIAQQMPSTLVSHYGPSVTTQALVECNAGAAIGVNNSTTSLYNSNKNTSLYVNNTINTHSGENTGYLGGYNLNVTAKDTYASDGNISSSNGTIDANYLHTKGSINARKNIKLQGKTKATIEGNIKADSIAVKSENQIVNLANLNSSTTSLDAKNIEQQGNVTASENTIINGDKIYNAGTVQSKKIIITEKNPDTKKSGTDLHVLYNKGNLLASELLAAQAGNILLKENSHISGENIYCKSDGFVKNDGTMDTQQLVIDADRWVANSRSLNIPIVQIKCQDMFLEKTSDITAQHASFQTDELWKNDGKLKAEYCQVESKGLAINDGTIDSSEELQINAANILCEEQSNITTKDAHYKAKENVILGGTMDIEKGTVNAGGQVSAIGKIGASEKLDIEAVNIAVEKTADIFAKASELKAKDVLCDGTMNLEKGIIDAQGTVKFSGKFNSSNELEVKNAEDINITETGNISANKASLRAKKTITNKGNVGANVLNGHANYIENSGKMNATQKVHIKADRYFWNQRDGSLTSDGKLTIDAAILLNTYAEIRAKNLRTHTLIDANIFGTYAGDTISQNSIIGFNTGILQSTLQPISSYKNLCNTVATRVLPRLAIGCFPALAPLYTGYKLCTLAASLAVQGPKLYKLYKKAKLLYAKDDLCVSDMLPFLFKSKDFICIGKDLIHTGCEGYELLRPTKTTPEVKLKDTSSNTAPIKPVSQNEIPSVLSPYVASPVTAVLTDIASGLGSQFSRDSLIDINGGLMLGINGNSQSLYNANFGASVFVNNSMSTMSGINRGLIGGSNVSVNALQSYSSDGLAVANNISMTANDLSLTGHTYGFNDVVLKAHNNAVIDRQIKARNIAIEAKNVLAEENAAITSANKTNIRAHEEMMVKGTVNGQETNLEGNQVTLAKGSKVVSEGNNARTTITAQKVLTVENGAQVNSQGGQTTLKSEEHAEINGAVKGNKTCITAKTLTLEENAHVSSATETKVIAEEKLINKSTIDGKTTTLQSKEIILEESSKVSAQDGPVSINAKTLHLQNNSQINGKTASVIAESIKGEKGNTITSTDGTRIKTNELDNAGSVNGPLSLQFPGEENQLKRIGQVEDLTYSGTLDNKIADKLVNGHNELLDIKEDSSLLIKADTQNVHLTEEHKTSHAFAVEGKANITCDKNLSSEQSIQLKAEGDLTYSSVESKKLTHVKGKNISSRGRTIRKTEGENYTDYCEKNRISGAKIIIDAQQNIDITGTDIHSGTEGTDIYFGKKFISDALVIEKHTQTEEYKMGGWRKKHVESVKSTEDTIRTSVPNTISSKGTTRIHGNMAEFQGTIFDSEKTIIDAKIQQLPMYDTHIHEEKIIKDGKAIYHDISTSKKERPIEFKDTAAPHIISDEKVSLSVTCNAPNITIDAPAVELRVTKETTNKILSEDKIHWKIWNKGDRKSSHDVTHGPSYNGTLNTNAPSIYIEDTKNSIPTTVNTTANNPNITRSLMQDIHEYKKEKLYSRPTPLLINTAALIASIGTNGLASSLGTGFKVAFAGINAFGLNAAHTLLQSDGNYKDAAKQMVKPQVMRTIAAAMLMSAATLGADQALNKFIPQLSHATNLKDRLLFTAPRELLHGGIRCAGDIALGKNPQEAVKRNAQLTAAGILGTALSGEIGQLYRDKKIDPLTHKALHAGVGAMEGAILDGKKGAIAGAIGAGVAETVADIARPKAPCLESILRVESQLGRTLTKNEFAQEWKKQTVAYLKRAHTVGGASKIMGATAAVLAQQDIDIAFNTGSKAVDHNFLILAGYAIAGLSTMHSAYQIHTTYKEEGAVEALKKLGIEVVCNVAGGKIATTAGKTLFKCGGITYTSVRKAINAALNQNPGLKSALGNITESLIAGSKKVSNTWPAKKAVRAGEWMVRKASPICAYISNSVDNIEKRVINTENLVKNKISDQLAAGINDLPENFVTQSVLNKNKNKLLSKVESQTPKAPLKPSALIKNPKIKSTSELSKAKRELTKKPARNIPKYATTPTGHAESLQAEKTAHQPISGRKNADKHVDKSSSVNKNAKSLNKPAQDKAKSLGQPPVEQIKPAVIAPDSVLQQDVALSMKQAAQQEIAKAQHSLSILEKDVERFRNRVSHDKVGEILNIDMSCVRIDKLEMEAKKFYDFIRSTQEDINAIAKNTGISERILNQIKNHVFIEEHILRDNAITRFHPCVDMAAAWKRLMANNFVYSDLVLLQHELAESFAMQGTKIPYNIAHPLVNEIYNWEILYK